MKIQHLGVSRGRDRWRLPDGREFHGTEAEAEAFIGVKPVEDTSPVIDPIKTDTEAEAKAKAEAEAEAKLEAEKKKAEAKAKAEAEKDSKQSK